MILEGDPPRGRVGAHPRGLPLRAITLQREGGQPRPARRPLEAARWTWPPPGKTLAEIALELRRSEFDAASLLFELHERGLVEAGPAPGGAAAPTRWARSRTCWPPAAKRLEESRYDAALEAYEEVLALDRLNQNAKKGLIAVIEARGRERALRTVPLDKVPVLRMDMAELTRQNFDPQEGFVLSRVNGEWDVRSILKLCPMAEEEALLIFSRLLERKSSSLQ